MLCGVTCVQGLFADCVLCGVCRANLQTQLTDFSESMDSLYEEMKHQRKLTER